MKPATYTVTLSDGRQMTLHRKPSWKKGTRISKIDSAWPNYEAGALGTVVKTGQQQSGQFTVTVHMDGDPEPTRWAAGNEFDGVTGWEEA